LAIFTKHKAFFNIFPTAPSKPRILAGDSSIPHPPCSSLAPRAFHKRTVGKNQGRGRARGKLALAGGSLHHRETFRRQFADF
jgi:hypothetical protein